MGHTTERRPSMIKLGWLLSVAAPATCDECILWSGSTDGSAGYGKVWIPSEKKMQFAHRVSCKAAHGDPPTSEHEAAHNCGVRLCVNGSHLRWATKLENMADMKIHGTQNPMRGEKSGTAKLTEQQVREILAAPRGYGTGFALAAKYGVSDATISMIRRGNVWRHI